MEITTDPDHKFELSLQLDDLDAAVEIARTVPELEAELDEKEELYGEGVDPFLELQDLCFEWVLQECQLTGACSSCQ